MIKRDARFLTSEAQEALRIRVVDAVRGGMSQTEAARVFGVSRVSVNGWMKRASQCGVKALRTGARGRPKSPMLPGRDAARAVRKITGACPDQLRLPFALWTREAVVQLLARDFDLSVSVWTAGRYLRSWGLTPQKPVRRAYERDPVAVAAWLNDEYPAIARRAKAERAEIHWGDEMGLRSDYQAGRSWGLRGKTPVIPGTGQRFPCNMISTITNRGRLAFMLFTENFDAPVFLRFLRRLVRLVGRKIFLIVDGHSAYKAAPVRRWLAAHKGEIEIFFLPTYSPDLNPDELLNNHVKTNTLGRRRPATRHQMIGGVRSFLRSTQRRPNVIQNFFRHELVRYAA
jgi:transposase